MLLQEFLGAPEGGSGGVPAVDEEVHVPTTVPIVLRVL
jgi:hypothetical protein